jgi:hypothetical protein
MGHLLSKKTCEKFFNCMADSAVPTQVPDSVVQRLSAESQRHAKATISQSLEANNKHFNEAREKLEKWADDLVLVAEKALKDTKEQIKMTQRQARLGHQPGRTARYPATNSKAWKSNSVGSGRKYFRWKTTSLKSEIL